MIRICLNIILVLMCIYLVPFLIYGIGTVIAGLKPPSNIPPGQFLISILISKIGTAIAFVLIFYMARASLTGQWFMYACVWWVMFTVGEAGQAMGPNYGVKQAVAGIISETIYFPVSAYLTDSLAGGWSFS